MTEEKVETVETPETNYIDIINKLKADSVSKEEYERVVKDNKVLAENLAFSKASPEEEKTPPTTEDITKLRERFVSSHNESNLDFIRNVLDLRDAILETGGRDPFLPTNTDYVENEADQAKCQAIADGLRQMVDYSDKDAALFNSELKRCCK